jgi:hypothetical protein
MPMIATAVRIRMQEGLAALERYLESIGADRIEIEPNHRRPKKKGGK